MIWFTLDLSFVFLLLSRKQKVYETEKDLTVELLFYVTISLMAGFTSDVYPLVNMAVKLNSLLLPK